MTLLHNFLLHAFGSSLIKGISLLLIPLSTRYLMPADMGFFALCNSFITIVSVFLACGIRQVFWLEFFHKTHDERRRMVNESIVMYLLLSVPLLALLVWYLPTINRYVFLGSATTTVLLIVLLTCFLTFFTELFFQVLVYRKQTKRFLLIQVCGAMVTLVTSVGALVGGYGVLGLLVGQVSGYGVIAMIAGWHYVQKNMFAHIDIARILTTWKFYLIGGLPFIPSLLSAWLMSSSNRWLLAYYSSLHDVGIYAVVEMVATAFQLLILKPFNNAYVPYFFERCANNKACLVSIDEKNKRYMWLSLAALASVGFVLFFALRPLVCLLLPPAYQQAIPYSLLMAFSQILLLGTAFAACFIQFSKRTWFISGSLLVSAGSNVGLSWFLIPRIGLIGAFIALLVSSVIYFCITLWYNWYLHRNMAV